MTPRASAPRSGWVPLGVALALWAFGGGSAAAQTDVPKQTPLPPAPPEQIAPPATGSATSGNVQNPSEALSKSRGTITPPNVDPGIAAPAPNAAPDPMPVIPPPGSPGGNPTVVPK